MTTKAFIALVGSVASAYLNPYPTAFGTLLGLCMPTPYLHYRVSENESNWRLDNVREIVISSGLIALACTPNSRELGVLAAAMLGFTYFPRIGLGLLNDKVSNNETQTIKAAINSHSPVEQKNVDIPQSSQLSGI